MHHRTANRPGTLLAVGLVVGALALAGCSPTQATASRSSDETGTSSSAAGGTVVLVTHDSFALPDDLIKKFESDTGLTLQVRAQGDAGAMVNQLVLTKDAPIGDAVFGIDNTFASRAVSEGVLQPYRATLPAGAENYAYDAAGSLTPIDVGDVCVNADLRWFTAHDLAVPTTLEDLTKPEYANLLAVENPATSSPGLAFLLATVGAFGQDGWQTYWKALAANKVTVAASWSDAYYSDFSGPSSQGDKPLVVSYASSPPYEVPEGSSTAPTTALLGTCFRQVEYAGVLAGAANPDGAKKVVDWLLSPQVQAAIPEAMYVYPVDSSVSLPDSWTRFAPMASKVFTVAPADIAAHRDAWIKQWTDIVVG